MKLTTEKRLRTMLIDDVRDRLLPIFIEKGFACVPLPLYEADASEMRTAFPLGRLKRDRDGKLEIIEVQFDRYRKPRFVINFGIAPETGITTPWGDYISRDELCPSGCPVAFRLHSSARRARWFGFGVFTPKSEAAIRRIVDEATVLSPEISAWFESGSVGRHMRKFGLSQ